MSGLCPPGPVSFFFSFENAFCYGDVFRYLEIEHAYTDEIATFFEGVVESLLRIDGARAEKGGGDRRPGFEKTIRNIQEYAVEKKQIYDVGDIVGFILL